MIAKTCYASSRWQAASTAVHKACRAKQPTVAAQNPAQNRAGSAKIGTFVTASWFQEILICTILWSETGVSSFTTFMEIYYFSKPYRIVLMFFANTDIKLIDRVEINDNKDILFRSNKYPLRIDCKLDSYHSNPSVIFDSNGDSNRLTG